jgi:uncharacterized protein YutE (UPF0331/DUF86 family)
MNMNGIVQRKLALLDEQVTNLEVHLKGVSVEEFREDWVLRCMAERALQVAVEIVIDIAERLLALRDAGPVETAVAAIERLARLGVIASSDPYRDMVRFRNLIVHEYESIDPDILYGLATSRLADFRRFRDELDQGKV